jgi:hypothetical protein
MVAGLWHRSSSSVHCWFQLSAWAKQGTKSRAQQ